MKNRWTLMVGASLITLGCGGGSDAPGGVVVAEPDPVSLQDVQAAVFTPNCAVTGCHVAGTAAFGLDLGPGKALNNLVGVPSSERSSFDRIEPFDPQNSYVYMKVTADPRILGDPMPPLGPPLADQQIDLLHDWIEQGAIP